jgi:predicted nucleic acid-binding protein
MTRLVLDTNVLIGGTPVIGPEYELSVSSVTYAELEAGTRLAETGTERARRTRRLAMAREIYGAGLPFDDRVAASFGTLAELFKSSGRSHRCRTAHLIIAATAHAYDAELLTHNVGDFVGLENAITVLDAAAGRTQ